MEIENLENDDLIECSRLYVSIFKEAPWNEEWSIEDAFERLSAFQSCPNTVSLKAVHDGEIIGFLAGEIQRWNGAHYYYLKEICVSRKGQRKGVGSALTGNLTMSLKSLGVSKIYLITQRDSVPSSFYSSLGYTENSSIMIMGKSVE